MSARRSREWVLARQVVGMPSPADFQLKTVDLPDLKDGQFLARVILASVDPGVRSRLSASDSYAAALPLGGVVDGFNVAQVIESRHANFQVGQVVAGGGGWREHILSDGRGILQTISDRRVSLGCWIGILGVPGLTAWFGLNRVAQAKSGETLLVTSAAGPVGATAGQLGKALGMTVIGVAGGPNKCAWLRDEAGFDTVIDYKAVPDLTTAVVQAAPGGIDVLFDNVGNAMIDRILPMMKMRGRIVVSGQVADYNTPVQERPGLKNTAPFITHRLRMEGLVVFDDLRNFGGAQMAMADRIVAGTLKYRIDEVQGLDGMAEAFCGLFHGENFGRRLVRLAPDPGV